MSATDQTAAWPVFECTHDGQALRRGDASLSCDACGAVYPIERGVIRFLGTNDPFYEGAYESHTAYTPRADRLPFVLPLWLINSGFVWSIRSAIAPRSTVVEVGCASGVAYFGVRYRMVGIDVSQSSLEKLARHYSYCLQANALDRLPLATASVDAVVSSFFWEHLDVPGKKHLLKEIRRVLRPGGKIVFLYDIATANPLVAWFRRVDPVRYTKTFLQGDGHIGYQTSRENEEIFRAAGFKLLRMRGYEKTFIQSNSVYSKLGTWPSSGARLMRWMARLSSGRTFYLYTAAHRVWDSVFSRVLPREWARIELAEWQLAES